MTLPAPVPSPARKVGGMDLTRERILRRKLESGLSLEIAWAQLATDPGFGFGKWKGAASIPEQIAAKLLRRWCERVGSSALAQARAASSLVLAEAAIPAARTLARMASGEVDGDDADAENIRLRAADRVLRLVGHGTADGDGRVAAAAAVSVSVSASASSGQSDTVRRVMETPEGVRVLSDLERIVRDAEETE